jgi:glycosyltransferase involved in cell wall biosynthesis
MPEVSNNLRELLGIPKFALVGVRYGGIDTFDISWVQQEILDLLGEFENLYFVFANTYKFLYHERAIFLEARHEVVSKAEFLRTGDFFLHARQQGESFGLAILESFAAGVPVFAFEGGEDLNHTRLVPKDYLYRNAFDLRKLILTTKFPFEFDVRRFAANYSQDRVGEQLLGYIGRIS